MVNISKFTVKVNVKHWEKRWIFLFNKRYCYGAFGIFADTRHLVISKIKGNQFI